MDAAIAALLGAAIGTVGSVGGVWLQQRHQTQRELLKTATELATNDYNEMVERVKLRGGGKVPPISIYVAYHAAVLVAIAKGKFGPDTVKKIEDEQNALLRAFPDRTKGK